jgi:hypothetical protein
MESKAVIRPKETVKVGVVRVVSQGAKWTLSNKFRWTESEPDAAFLASLLKDANKGLDQEIQVILALRFVAG